MDLLFNITERNKLHRATMKQIKKMDLIKKSMIISKEQSRYKLDKGTQIALMTLAIPSTASNAKMPKSR